MANYKSIYTGQEIDAGIAKANTAIQDVSNKQDTLVSGTNIKTINNQSLLGSGNITISGGSSGLKEVYVNNATGNDSNDGTSWNNAKKTFANALASADDDCTLFFEGDTNERLNIKTNPNQKVLRIIGRDGVRNRILGGTKLVDFQTTNTTGVYKIETPNTSAFSSNYYSIVQDNVIDTSTAISSYEAHPAQKGREYRLLSTPIPRKTSVANVTSSTVGFYHDGTNLYVKPASTDFTNHPIYCPTENGGIYGNDGSCLVEISNVEVWHSPLLITNCPNAKLTDCTCCFALGTGGIKYDDSVNVIIKRCEAAYTLNTSGYGDGINAHSSKYESLSGNTNDSKIKYVSAELIDCWCHDCSDDGWSDHSACEVIIRGGLYEYNHKGGVTPSSGGKCTCYDVMTRKNCRGFYYVSSSTYQKEKTAYFYCENCISDTEDATRVSQGVTRLAGAGFSGDDKGVTQSGWEGIRAKFVNCKSLNNLIGFGAGKKTKVNLIDCSTLNNTNNTQTLDDGTITFQSTTILGNVAVTGVSLDRGSASIVVNSTTTLTATIAPSTATNKNVTWSTDSQNVTLTPNGLTCTVEGTNVGSATVTATTQDGSYTASCSVTVTASSVAVTGVSLDKSTETIGVDNTTTLVATITPADATNQNVTWSTNSQDVTLTPSGLSCIVEGINVGNATVTVTTQDGSYTDTCAITVLQKELVSLTVTGTLAKTEYADGDTLDITGLTVTANFDDSSTSTLTASDLTIIPDPLTTGTTSAVLSYTYNGITKTATVSGITVVPLKIIWEQGAISSTDGNVESDTRIRTMEYLDLTKVTSLTVNTLNGAKSSWWGYTNSGNRRAVQKASGWTEFNNTVLTQSVVGGRYVRLAVRKSDEANIVPSEASTYISIQQNT